MIPGNVDPRRPEKVQRYKSAQSNGTPADDLTPDYMNILGEYLKKSLLLCDRKIFKISRIEQIYVCFK